MKIAPTAKEAAVNEQDVSDEALLANPRVAELVSAAVATAAARAAEETAVRILADIQAKREVAGTVAEPGADQSLARTLALEIARMADQGTSRKRLPPDVLEARERARIRMEQLIVEAAANDHIPTYRLMRAVYLDEVLVQPTYIDRNHVQKHAEIEWPQVPNEAMLPINQVAREIYAAFMESIGGTTANVITGADRPALKVLHQADIDRTPAVGGRQRGDLKILGRSQAGDVVETSVLGTVAAPARSVG